MKTELRVNGAKWGTFDYVYAIPISIEDWIKWVSGNDKGRKRIKG